MSSYEKGKKEIREWIHNNFKIGSRILDVGACDGKWKKLIGACYRMDAVEIFAPNVINNHLYNIYENVFIGDIQNYQFTYYDLIIFGDVIEHMAPGKAAKVINHAKNRCKDMIIAVPFKYPQDELYGNPFEKHIQDDLTEELFHSRYPGFESLWIDDNYGYFHLIERR